MHHKANDGVL